MKTETYIIKWSDEDNAFVGSCPPWIGECCHGPDVVEVSRQLIVIVEEWKEERGKAAKRERARKRVSKKPQ